MRIALLISLYVSMLSGCTFSVHPILNKQDLTTDVDLTGTWKQQLPADAKPRSSPAVVTLEGFDNNTSYDATYTNHAQDYEVQVGKIGEQRYLQGMRLDLSLKNDSPVLARVPVYSFAKFEIEGDELRIYVVNDRQVRALLKNNDIAFRDYKPSDMLEWCIITERTSRIQDVIREQGGELFQEQPTVFHRVKEE